MQPLLRPEHRFGTIGRLLLPTGDKMRIRVRRQHNRRVAGLAMSVGVPLRPALPRESPMRRKSAPRARAGGTDNPCGCEVTRVGIEPTTY